MCVCVHLLLSLYFEFYNFHETTHLCDEATIVFMYVCMSSP